MTIRYILLTAFVFALISCGPSGTESEKHVTTSSTPDMQTFDRTLISLLYKQLHADFEIEFEEKHLDSLLHNQNILDIKNGATIEKEMLFESFECECFDKLRLSFSNSDDRYTLWVYVEFYEKDLDWCPESSYSYSFMIKNHEITDLKLGFMAG